MNNESHQKIVEQIIKWYSISNIDKLQIDNINKNNETIMKLFNSNSKQKIHKLFLNIVSGEDLIDSTYFMSGFENFLPAITNQILLWNLKFSNFELVSTIKSAENTESLCFECWKFNLDSDLKALKERTNISNLSFYWWGIHHENNWGSNLLRFQRLIKFISSSKLKDSLQKLNIGYWGITISSASKLMTKYMLTNVKLILSSE